MSKLLPICIALLLFSACQSQKAVTDTEPEATAQPVTTDSAATNDVATVEADTSATNEVVVAEATTTTNDVDVAASPYQAPPGGFTWSDLTRLAIQRNSEIKALLGEAEAERIYGYTKATTRDPQLTLGYGRQRQTGDSYSRGSREAGLYNPATGAFAPTGTDRESWGSQRDLDRDRTVSARLRVYTSNPFVNKHLRAEGTGRAEELLGKAQAVRHDIAESIFLLCADYTLYEQEKIGYEAIIARQNELIAHREKQAEAGVVTRYEILSVKMKQLDLMARVRDVQFRQGAICRELAMLTGIDVSQVTPAQIAVDYEALAQHMPETIDLYNEAVAAHPELMIARGKETQAEAQERAAKAKRIPWFEYIDATYARNHGTGSSSESGGSYDPSAPSWPIGNFDGSRETGTGNDSSSGHEWEVRVAITVPIFSWFSKEAEEARLRRYAASAQQQAIFRNVYGEISAIVDDFKASVEAHKLYAGELQEMLVTLDETLEDEAQGVDEGDKIKAQIERQEMMLRQAKLQDACTRSYGALLSTLSLTTDMTEAIQ